MRGMFLVGLLMLGGCAPTIKANNELGGIIDLKVGHRENAGLALADAECQKYGKRARITNNDEWTGQMRYECVKP
ncbi:hypothetical protein ACFSTI_24965 [Rhizorhabdus histidinilytica]|uniref:Uncharacterized protein n=1 Tax=Rhizorhabdus histidinilytica TaxID=439228 RepID=A0A1T5A963_9SPHN|nr:hypothetical protein [Rhizorhabdus histidinilytica]SKB31267.1 hypothetical protein SAMN06295920_101703 [Rhizorhabdus histidinilytica]